MIYFAEMKRLFVVIIFFICYCFSAQTQRFLFEFSYKLDSTAEHREKENYILDVTSKEVKFYPQEFISIDSLNKISRELTKIALPNGFNTIVKRKLNSSINDNYGFSNGRYYKFETTDTIEWQLKNEMKKVEDYQAQLAEANYGGRKWSVWFVKEIPFNEGPYKLNGLPGFIVEAYDEKESFHFKLTKINNIKMEPDTSGFLETNFGDKPIKVSLEQFNNLLLNDYYNVYGNLKAMPEGEWSITLEDGKKINTLAELNMLIRETKNKIRKNYNPINKEQGIKYPLE